MIHLALTLRKFSVVWAFSRSQASDLRPQQKPSSVIEHPNSAVVNAWGLKPEA
jgi:hypothetical protein